jgi:hypothetical protein
MEKPNKGPRASVVVLSSKAARRGSMGLESKTPFSKGSALGLE